MTRLLYFICLVLLSGCSTFTLLKPTDSSTIHALIKENNYAAAFKALDSYPPAYRKSAQFDSLKSLVKNKAVAYENSVLDNLHREENKNNLATSLQLVNEALLHYPQSKRLADERKRISIQFNRQLELLKAQSSISESSWLLQEERLQQQLSIKDPSDLTAASNLKQVKKRMEAIATDLVGYGIIALRNNEHTLAERCLKQAQLMTTSEAVQQSIHDLEKKILAYHEQRSRRQQQKTELASKKKRLQELKQQLSKKQQARKILNSAILSLSENDFSTTHTLIQAGKDTGFYQTQFADLEIEYNKKLDIKLDHDLKLGVSLYKKGQIQNAQRIWKSALALKPSHSELKLHLQRANRVLKKLSELRSETPADSSASD